jgi:site-specific DNA-methyltransferase (adenine-specific)
MPATGALDAAKADVQRSLEKFDIAILPPCDVMEALNWARQTRLDAKCTILDPWYNKGIGGTRPDYAQHVVDMLRAAGECSEHVFFWGFPEIVAPFVERIPKPLELIAWLTWYYKNSPSVIRGWRSSQNACLHLARPGARLHPEHFLNEVQTEKLAQGKLRYMPGPTSVIEEPLLCGFVGRDEQTGHPAQKPVAVFKKLILMTTQPGDLVLDPMCGSGTTGEAAGATGRKAVLSDESEEYTQIAEHRLGVPRIGRLGEAASSSRRRAAQFAKPGRGVQLREHQPKLPFVQ